MKLNVVDHIAIISSDIEKTKEFYINKLGFQLIKETIRQEKDDIILDLRINEDTKLEIFIKQNSPIRITNPEARGLRHLAFKVDDINLVVKELKEKDIECEEIRKDKNDKSFTFFFDPDGLPIEIHE